MLVLIKPPIKSVKSGLVKTSLLSRESAYEAELFRPKIAIKKETVQHFLLNKYRKNAAFKIQRKSKPIN